MSEKRFYWLKLPEDFFRQKEIKRLRQISGGDTFVIVYLKMLLLSLKDDGRLYYDNIMEDFISELALDLDESPDNVSVTVNYLLKAGILLEVTPSEYEILTAKVMTGSETSSAVRKRRSRERQIPELAGKCHSNVTERHTEIEKSKRRVREEAEPEAEPEAEAEPPPPPPGRAEAYFREKIDSDPSPSSMETLGKFEKELGTDVCIRAIDEAMDYGKRYWGYICGILMAKQEKGVRSLEDWDRVEAGYRAGKEYPNNPFLQMLKKEEHEAGQANPFFEIAREREARQRDEENVVSVQDDPPPV